MLSKMAIGRSHLDVVLFTLLVLSQLPVNCHSLISQTNEVKSLSDLYICTNESMIANNKTIDKNTVEFVIPSEFTTFNSPYGAVGRLHPGGLQCKFGHFHETFILPFSSNTTSRGIADNLTRARVLTLDRRLLLGNLSYALPEFCVDYMNTTRLSLKVCHKHKRENALSQNCSDTSPCIRKCCKQDELWNISSGACQKNAESHWAPYFYKVESDCVMKSPLGFKNSGNTSGVNQVVVIDGLPSNCLSYMDRHTIPSKNVPGYALGRFRNLVNGSVLVNIRNGSWQEVLMDDFCVDRMVLRTHDSYGSHNYAGDVLLVCKDEISVRGKKARIPLKYAAMLLGASVILLITAVVYLLLWNKHNVYEWTVFFEVISMLFMIISVGAAHTVARDPTEGHLGSRHCTIIGAVSHFFFLATFFWLFIINFEIWWNFRTLTIRKKKPRRWLRLINYHVFGWGCPLVMITIGLILDSKFGLQNEEIDCSNIIVPNYGQLNCYISKAAQGPYLYYPIGVLLGFNLLFYSMTVFKMCGYQKQSQSITKNRSNGHFQPVVVFARLFIVMGVSWISEIVAWAVSPKSQGTIPLYWIVFDVVTLVQAIAIFTIFVCRKDNLHKLLEKYPSLSSVLSPLTKLSCCALPPAQQTPVQIHRLSLKNAANDPKRLQVSPGNVSTSSNVTVIMQQNEV